MGQGELNDELTELGFEQARQAGEKARGLKIDKIISAPSKRVRQTAEVVAEVIGYPMDKIELDDELKERNMGELTGRSLDLLQQAKSLAGAPDNVPGIETRSQLYERAIRMVEKLKHKKRSVLVVSSNGIGRMMQITSRGLPASDIVRLDVIPNAEVIKLLDNSQ